MELGSNVRLSEVVSKHFISWTELNLQVALGNLIHYKEVSDVEVSGALARTDLSIHFPRGWCFGCYGARC